MLVTIGFTANGQFQNSGFEEWHESEPLYWENYNYLLHDAVVTDSNGNSILPAEQKFDAPTEGVSSIRLNTFTIAGSNDSNFPDGNYGSLVRQVFNSTDSFTVVKMDLRYNIQSGDAAVIVVQAMDQNYKIIQNWSMQITGSQLNFQTVPIPFHGYSPPQGAGSISKYYVMIVSSEGSAVSNSTKPVIPGTWIEIDNITMESETANISEPLALKGTEVYPNPAKSTVNFMTPDFNNGKVVIQSIMGQEVVNETFSGEIKTLDVTHLKRGMYVYFITGDKGKTIDSGKLLLK